MPGQPPVYPYNYPQGPDPRAAARRAGVMLFVIGGLSILGGSCCGVMGSLIPQIIAQQPEIAQQIPPEVTPERLRLGMLIVAILALVHGIALVVLGFFVRKNSKAAIITAIVFSALALLYLAYNAFHLAIVGTQEGLGMVGGSICTTVIPVVLYGVLMTWLIQALRNVSAVRAAGQYPPEYLAYLQQQYAYQQQLWQHQQQQQQGGQVPPPVPPQAPPVQPPAGDGGTGGPAGPT